MECFNSSVGILSVGTTRANPIQTLKDDVSIPQSEFCPLGPIHHPALDCHQGKFQFLSRNSVRWDKAGIVATIQEIKVSIPQSEFCPLGHSFETRGIALRRLFQFLSRNSVRWDELYPYSEGGEIVVSIPQSEFCPLGHRQSKGARPE